MKAATKQNELERLRLAMRAIVEDRLPCDTCGVVHEPWNRGVGVADTYEDRIDGHPWKQPSAARFARRVLESQYPESEEPQR